MLLEFKAELIGLLSKMVEENQLVLLKDKVNIEESKSCKFGFCFTNLPHLLSSIYKKSLEESGQILLELFPGHPYISKVEVVGGYLNFFLRHEVIKEFFETSHKKPKIIFSLDKSQPKKKYLIEIISANPTGSLHIGHIRNGVVTDTLSNLLEYDGSHVFRSYLINDGGLQIKELMNSLHIIYTCMVKAIPVDVSAEKLKYSDSTVRDCAEQIAKEFGHYWDLQDPEQTQKISKFAVEYFLNLIKKEMQELRIQVDSWDYETQICSEGALSSLINKLKDHLYMKDQALWFKTSKFSSESDKDDVVVKSDGSLSYFGQDLIYHIYKLEFLGHNGTIINTLAADHKGHITRMEAFFRALEIPEDVVKFKMTQLSRLIIDGKKVTFSKRENILLSFKDLTEHLSIDEIRWFLSSRDEETELDIELEKLRGKDYNNPIFYILYAHSRAVKLIDAAKLDVLDAQFSFEKLNNDASQELINHILSLEWQYKKAVDTLKPHILAVYLYGLAKKFHSFYESAPILSEPEVELKLAKLALVHLVIRIFREFLPIFRIEPKKS
ncbi:arginyl-tRNA ligase [Candidatus Mycoplasma haematolamae str. Purdue]|uniref:Arginine--tRNA ligase n=1 Tax=Mycoplasma haematolamae (strain Purdue) TaxID=1212765 RepID=I7BK20_MYCHA|nr:arginine--tRNA ligase [Candidatus Mycoplasma haematolamae]AFO52218.1 arginyl-tRNA ligase [Candidatus Mycoplasma haematolamae str. Purdue]